MFRYVTGFCVFALVFSLAIVVFVLDDNEDDEVKVKVQSQLLDFKKQKKQKVQFTYLQRF